MLFHFRLKGSEPMKTHLGVALLTIGMPALLSAIELRPDTVKAWDDYVRAADSRMQARLAAGRHFLWSDEAPDRIARLRRGEIVYAPVAGRGTHRVPNGLIHDWIGAVFVPGATLDDLFAVVHDYERYKDIYKPVVTESKPLACTDADQKFSMVWHTRVLWIDAAMQGEYEAHDTLVDERRGYNINHATGIREIESYGSRGQHMLPPGQGEGFMWGLHSIARYEQRDGGVYFELEALALTRDIPASLAWMVNPVINRLSIRSLSTTLRQTRDAVAAVSREPNRVISCAASGRGLTLGRLQAYPPVVNGQRALNEDRTAEEGHAQSGQR
jgi:hypothetical protein